MKNKILFANKGNKKAEILIYDSIGGGWMGGISAQDFSKELKGLGDLDEINVRINSDGGSVFDGITIYNALQKHKAKVIVDVDGLAASIASIIAMAGDTVRIAYNAMFMVHDPWIVASGTSHDLREQADLLDKVRGQLVDTYVERSTVPRDLVDELMAAETWMTADEALDHGFVHEVTGEMKMAACVHPDRFKFKNTPAQLLEKKEFTPVVHDIVKEMRARLEARSLKPKTPAS